MSENIRKQFVDTVKNRKLDEVKKFINDHPNINRDILSLGFSWSIAENNSEIFHFLIEKDIDINFNGTTNKSTPLIAACYVGNKEMVEKIIVKDVNLDSITIDGQSALFVASYLGFYDIVALLLYEGANPDTVTNEGATALMVACHKGHENIIKLLLDGLANKEQKDYKKGRKYIDLIKDEKLRDEIIEYESNLPMVKPVKR